MKNTLLVILAIGLLAGSMTVNAVPVMYPEDVFVRGNFNAWGITDKLVFDSIDEIYEVNIDLEAGAWEFKVASEDWTTVDFGNIDIDPLVGIDTPKNIGTSSFKNLTLEIATAGTYLFTLSNTELQTATILVARVPESGTVFLIGLGLAGLRFARRKKVKYLGSV